jgi:multidrug resistance efflux pump
MERDDFHERLKVVEQLRLQRDKLQEEKYAADTKAQILEDKNKKLETEVQVLRRGAGSSEEISRLKQSLEKVERDLKLSKETNAQLEDKLKKSRELASTGNIRHMLLFT